ncbi:MAG: hypothetical protein ABI584_06025 [Acidobacteriota bacterium]
MVALAGEMNGSDPLNRSVAGRVFLSSGDVVEVAYTVMANGTSTTLHARDTSTGVLLTVHEKMNFEWMRSETTVSDGKTTIVILEEVGYYNDRLPVPVQVKIGSDVYRALMKPSVLADDMKKLRAAMARQPAPFIATLKHLIPIGSSLDFTMASLAGFDDLFEPGPELKIAMTKKMELAEIDALVRDVSK